MWINEFQNILGAVVLFIASNILLLIVKIFLERIIFVKKLFDFFGHLVPAVVFLAMASSGEICRIVGEYVGLTEKEGFYALIAIGFMFLASTTFFLLEIYFKDFRKSIFNQNHSKKISK